MVAISSSILKENNQCILACKDEDDVCECFDTLTQMVGLLPNTFVGDDTYFRDKTLYFKNGSYIKVISPETPNSRGKRSEIKPYYNDCDICYDREIVDEVLKPFCKKDLSDKIKYLRKHPSEYIYLISGKKLPLWRRIWVDKIFPLIKR